MIYGVASDTQGTLDLAVLSTSEGCVIQGAAVSDQTSVSVSSAGDVNGDGIDDLIVAASGADAAGAAYVIYGQIGNDRGTVDLASLTADDGFTIHCDALGDALGASVAAAGDVNNDGFDDLIVEAIGGDDGGSDAGEAYIIHGFSDLPPAVGLPRSLEATEDEVAHLDLSGLVFPVANPTGDVSVVLDAEAGTLVAEIGDGITTVLSDGGQTLTVTCTLTALTAYFDTLRAVSYLGALDANGLDNTSVTLTDLDGEGDVASGAITISIGAVNDAPTLAAAIADQAGEVGLGVSSTVPGGTFADVDGDTLTLSATFSDGAELPDWLSFHPISRAFTGVAPESAEAALSIVVTASDGSLSTSDTFDLVIAPAATDHGDPTGPVEPDVPDLVTAEGGGSDIQGGDSDDLLSAPSGSNIIDGSGGDDVLAGGFDDDRLFGGAGIDILIGDNSGFIAGVDLLDGGSGDDLMEGGGGADTIGIIALDYDTPGNSLVTRADFVSSVDTVALSGFGLADGAAAYALVTDVDGVATFSDQGTVITFTGLTTADLGADDFLIL